MIAASISDVEPLRNTESRRPPLSLRETAHAAALIAPLWFGANFMYNQGLALTSVTSSTVISSTSSLFTYTFARLHTPPLESFSWIKLLGCFICAGGVVLTAFGDAENAGG